MIPETNPITPGAAPKGPAPKPQAEPKPVSALMAKLLELRGLARAGKIAQVDYWAEGFELVEQAIELAKEAK